MPEPIITATHTTPDGAVHRVDVYPVRPDARGVPSHEVTLDGDAQRTFIAADVLSHPVYFAESPSGVRWVPRPASPGELLDAAIDALTEIVVDAHADGPVRNGAPA